MSLLYSLRSFYSFRARVTNAIGNNIVSNCSQCFFHNCKALFYFFLALHRLLLAFALTLYLYFYFLVCIFLLCSALLCSLTSLCFTFCAIVHYSHSSFCHMCALSRQKKFHVGLSKRTVDLSIEVWALSTRTHTQTCETNESHHILHPIQFSLSKTLVHTQYRHTHCASDKIKTCPKSFSKSNRII